MLHNRRVCLRASIPITGLFLDVVQALTAVACCSTFFLFRSTRL
jgi:hypothetical protein